ncbi:uncharacterized protein LOC133392279 [Anopheles gambiae]|uniref:uncharacterized protein LOC133392279 n=1 Tax=Anopheles gambiae TaxID=7165 RepID=UPI002AC9769A|nr:uncharacterized protein LOC133392279 [Anopheles gambiae]
MHIIGITCTAEDGTQQTILVQPSTSLLNVTARGILPWFFSQDVPLFGVIAENSVAVRVKTATDPFRHLRHTKSASFDGKGFTLRRSVKHSGIIRIDGVLKIPIEEFYLLCPGLFYGTAKYPNLNLLLSQRRFRQQIVSPATLWTILSDCLLCRQYSNRQRTQDDFKLEMRRKYLATQLKDFRPMIAELEERLKETVKYDQLKKMLQQTIATVHSRQVQRYKDQGNQLKRMLQSVSNEKEQLLAERMVHDTDTAMTMVREIVAAKVDVTCNELENMLDQLQAELVQLSMQLELQQTNETKLGELNEYVKEIEHIFSRLDATDSMEFEMQIARCAIANNQSLVLFSKLSDEHDKQHYISNLQTHAQSLTIDIRSAEEHVQRAANEKRIAMENLHLLNDLANDNTLNSDPPLDDILSQLHNNLKGIVRAAMVIANVEDTIAKLQQKIWHEFSAIGAVPFAELEAIAAVKFAVEEQLDANAREGFLGFVYDRILEAGSGQKWIEGFSCTAIFKTLDGALRVQQLVGQMRADLLFSYIVLNTRLRSSLNSFFRDSVTQVLSSATATNYEDTVVKVNSIVQHMVSQLRAAQELKSVRERLKQLLNSKAELIAELDHVRSASNVPAPRMKFAELPKLAEQFIKVENHKLRLQAHHASLVDFIHQLETDVPLPTEEQLKSDGLRLQEELKTILENVVQNRKRMYDGVKQLTEAYHKLQFAWERWNDDHRGNSCLMAAGLSSPTTKKLIDCWTTCCESIRHGIASVEEVRNRFKPTEEEPSPEVHELGEQIKSLELRERSIATRVVHAETILAEYQQEHGNTTIGQERAQYSEPRLMAVETDDLMGKIVRTREQLRRMPPGLKGSEVVKMKNKLKHLQLLEKIRLNAREMCLNNMILPIIDKLHVQKLRQVCQLVACISDELPELGGIATVTFGCASIDREQDEAKPFNIDDINAVNVHIINEEGAEIEMNETQRQLAYLILFLCFLYCDNCKLVQLDKTFEQLFDCGIVSLFHVLEKYFPTMQFIVLDNNAQ